MGDACVEPSIKKKELVYGAYVVAVLDILGQKNAIRHLAESRPGTVDDAEIIKALKDSIGVRDGLCSAVKSSIDAFSHAPNAIAAPFLSGPQREEYDSLGDRNITTYYFGDTLIAYSRAVTAQGYSRVQAIYGMLSACAAAMLSTLAVGRPVRGGIEIGFALEPRSGEVYGPAFLAAYELEQEVAQYPRIVVGSQLTMYLHALLAEPTTSPVGELRGTLAEKSLRLIARDEDGCMFVDYLGDELRETVRSTLLDEPLVEKGLAFARREHERFIQENKTKLAGRYAALRRYFECKAPAWLGPK